MKTLQQKAEHHWMNVLGMAEPKYCGNSSYEYFEKGFIAGALEERERAKGLVKALEWISKGPTWGPGAPDNQTTMASNAAKKALKEYNEGVGDE